MPGFSLAYIVILSGVLAPSLVALFATRDDQGKNLSVDRARRTTPTLLGDADHALTVFDPRELLGFRGSGFETLTYGRICCSRRALIPRIASKSSTRSNGPLFSRNCTMAFAVDAPTPGNCASSAAVAVFRSSGLAGGSFLAATPEAITKPQQNRSKSHIVNFVFIAQRSAHVAQSQTRPRIIPLSRLAAPACVTTRAPNCFDLGHLGWASYSVTAPKSPA